MSTMDPAQIRRPSQIPPAGSDLVGSAEGLADVYSGTLPGDVDAQPSAKELLGTAPDTGPLSNVEYIYRQISALYGGTDLPDFQSPSGSKVKAVVFVSGSSQGSYGAFHIEGATQADFDRMVVDSVNVSGSYSGGSSLPKAVISPTAKLPHVLSQYAGPADLLGVFYARDARLKAANSAAIQEALTIAAQSSLALKMAFEARNAAAIPQGNSTQGEEAKHVHEEVARRLVQLNQNLLGLVAITGRAVASRQYLSTALFAAEIVESFQTLTRKANPGRTDGEAVSRVLAFKLAPEIALIPGFNSAVSQRWWNDGHPDLVNDNSQNDQSIDGNAAGVMFLEFLTDYLGVPLDRILQHMPATGGAPLGQTYVALLNDFPQLAALAGRDGASAFEKMISLLQQNAQNPDGSLNLPANGNPFPSMPGAKQGGLFAGKAPAPASLARDTRAALGLQAQLEQQFASLESTLRQIQADVSESLAAAVGPSAVRDSLLPSGAAGFGYRPPLAASLVANLERRAAPYRAPQYDQTLQDYFWKHVYDELPGTGPHTDRLQVITGTIQAPLAVQVTGTIRATKLAPDGDLHIYLQQDDLHFPANQGAGVPPLEIEIIYARPVTEADAKQAQAGFRNPFDISQLGPGARIQAAGPLVFDRAHGQPTSDGQNVNSGLEIYPLVGMTVLSAGSHAAPPTSPVHTASTLPVPGRLSEDLVSAVGQAETLGHTLDSLTALLQKMKREAATGE